MEAAWPERFKIPAWFSTIAGGGRLGKKNGKGFYLYENGKRGEVDPEIYKLIGAQTSKSVSDQEIVDRCVLGYVNESMLCLEDDVIPSPYEGDVGSVFGVGFPPFLGGPFKYVDLCGPKEFLTRMRTLEGKFGQRFAPPKTFVQLADHDRYYFPEEGR
jgi:3-hydroxyacyl-CoA dehydrogenase/enoyl-CoA hydratase/3-hydroxybutyryl-CoA epimerase